MKKFKELKVSLDTEYTLLPNGRNVLLTYQLYILDADTNKEHSYIYYADTSIEERLTFRELILLMFKTAKIPNSQIDGYYINLICHFTPAEFAMLKDRKDIARYFEFVQKCVITFNKKHIQLEDNDGGMHDITFTLSDTMLLLPPSHRSLERATSLLDDSLHKKELSSSVKANMQKLLQEDKSTFEAYAMQDAKITLRLYMKLQELLNAINETNDVRYTTIGSATVKHYKKHCKNNFGQEFFAKQFSKLDIYDKNYILAKRAYMGGLNNSYYVGKDDNGVFIDIDFSSAYPTVMNLLQSSSFPQNVKNSVATPPLNLGGA
jgi:hypothetical protein